MRRTASRSRSVVGGGDDRVGVERDGDLGALAAGSQPGAEDVDGQAVASSRWWAAATAAPGSVRPGAWMPAA